MADFRFDFYVEIRDRTGTLVERLYKDDDILLDFAWGYDRIGGCAEFKLTTKHTLNDPPVYSGSFDIRLYMLNLFTAAYDLWYRGRVSQVNISLANIERTIITGRGYSTTLSKLTYTQEHTTDEISVIVTNILNTVIIPNTDITFSAGDIEATSFTPNPITFSNTSVIESMQTLADLAGSYEWGVGSDLKFFFKSRATTPAFFTTAGANIISFNWLSDYEKIINRIKLEGGTSGGSKFTRSINNTPSQVKWGLLEKVIQNSAITTDDVADQYGNSILAEQSIVSQRGAMSLRRSLTNENENTPIESTVPLGMLQFRRTGFRFGEKKFGTGTYGHALSLQIQKIKYKMINDGVDINLVLGRYVPDLALTLKQIEFDISQNRQRSV